LWVNVQNVNYNITIGAFYHPPKPNYKTSAVLDHIECCMDQLATNNNNSIIVLAGDMNSLPETEVVIKTGMTSVVNQPTRGSNCLDRSTYPSLATPK